MCIQKQTDGKTSREIKNLIKGNALKYERYKDNFDQIDSAEIIQYRDEIEEAFDRIVLFYPEYAGAKDAFKVDYVDHDPYKNLGELTNSIKLFNVMKISTLNNNSILLPGELNLKFRAVHDYLRYFLQQEFDFVGEYNVYKAQKLLHKSKIGKQILYSEVVLQAAYCEYFGAFATKQKIVL